MTVATKTKAKKTSKITSTGLQAEIRTCVQICLDAMNAETAADVARRTGLSVTTAYRLIAGDVTRAMHVGTLQALGYASGLRIEMTKTRITLSLAKAS